LAPVGRRPHDGSREDGLHDAGLDDLAPALDDASLDAGVAASTEEAVALAGPDIGSPVLELGDGRSLFGPILHAVPDDDGGARVWEAVLLLAAVPEYHELKRGPATGRTRRPAERPLWSDGWRSTDI